MDVTSFKEGIALIINFAKGRPGSEKDVKNLKEILIALNVSVVVEELSEDNVKEVVTRFINSNDFSQFEYVIIAYFSHGSGDKVLLQDKESITLQKQLLNRLFQVERLQGKLKWIILQACAGQNDIHINEADGPNRKKQEFFIKSYPSHEGCLSYRGSEGSIFITILCQNLRDHAESKDIMFILKSTVQGVLEYCQREGINGIPGLTQEPRNNTNLGKVSFYFKKDAERS